MYNLLNQQEKCRFMAKVITILIESNLIGKTAETWWRKAKGASACITAMPASYNTSQRPAQPHEGFFSIKTKGCDTNA